MFNDSHALLVEVQRDIRERYLPVLVCIAIFGFIGILGNIFTAGFYGFKSEKSTSIFLIACLACIDCIVCVLTVPLIIERYFNVIYTAPAACKIQHFFGHWSINSSVLILWLIAIDRHRKICKPFWRQISMNIAKKVLVGLVTFAFLLSVRDFANFDTNKIKIDLPNNMTLAGHWCSNTDNPNLKLSVLLFHAIDALILILILITMIVTYGHVIYILCKMKKFGNKRTQPHVNHLTDNAVDETKCGSKKEYNLNFVKLDEEHSNIPKPETSQKRSKKLKKSEINITIMMIVVSVGFITCFLPYFSFKLGIRSSKTAIYEMGLGIQFLLIFPYLNSIINPIIFCAFNPKFRKYIIGTIKSCAVQGVTGNESSTGRPSGTTDENQLSSY